MRRERLIGAILITLGALFLLGRVVDVGNFAWPLFIVLPGVALLLWGFVGGRGSSALVIPGSIVTTVGLILFLQNLTGRFETWAYAWGLVIASVGIGTWLHGALVDDDAKQREGTRTATVGLAFFAGFGVFFQFFVFGDLLGAWFFQWGVPLALIAAGAVLLLRRRRGGG